MKNDKQFIILCESIECYIIDRQRKKVIVLNNASFEDITKKCERAYNTDLKKPFRDRRQGGKWFGYVNEYYNRSDLTIWNDELVIETDDLKEFNGKILELMQKQINTLQNRLNSEVNYYNNDKQIVFYI